MAKNKSVRLSENIIPSRYKIMVRPDLQAFIFDGEETISLEIKKPTTEIILHSDELEVTDVSFVKEKFKIEPRKIILEKTTETVRFEFEKKLPVGEGQLNLKFKGILNDSLRGFYRSKHIVDGQDRYLATTQFESTDARKAFPCIDEPNRKAIFDVTLMIPAKTVAISNTIPTQITEHESGYQIVEFAPTPKMSTYLLAFIVGDFEYIETRTSTKRHPRPDRGSSHKTDPPQADDNDGILVRVFVTPGKKSQAKFALECAKRTLEFFEKYFDVKYPLPVMDLIAIPDFQAGAMENWGAVTYRETYLLVDEAHSSTATKQWVALVIAHELAHQWFGNLVTMEWWTHLWLNEGFASYIEYLAVNELFPEWDIWTQFVYLDLGSALSLDALENTHPIEVEVHHPDEITEIFDAVSYSKGAAVIRMLAGYLGFKDFREGLRLYLKTHQFGNAKTQDLWNAFEKVSGKPVTKIMANWTGKPGYPILTVLEGEDHLRVTQSRFYSNPDSRKKSTDKTIWNVPLKILTPSLRAKRSNQGSSKVPSEIASSQTPRNDDAVLLDKKSVTINKPIEGSWIKLNQDETSLVRVDYPAKYLHELKPAIMEKKLGPVDRLGIIRDAFDLAQADKLPTHEALRLCLDYINEDDYSAWAELASNFNSLGRLFYDESFFEEYKKLGREIFGSVAGRLGWQKRRHEKHTDVLLRSLVLYSFGTYGDEKTVKKAKELFNSIVIPAISVIPANAGIQKAESAWIPGSSPRMTSLEADLRGVVYNLVAENGAEKEYLQLLNLYKKAEMQEEQMRIARAMGNFRDKKLLLKTLEFSFSKEVRAQDTIFIVAVVWANPAGSDLAWEFVKKNWIEFAKRYSGGHLLSRLIEPAKVMKTTKDHKDIQKFFEKNKTPEAERTIRQILEQIHSNVAWLERDKKGVGKFLKLI